MRIQTCVSIFLIFVSIKSVAGLNNNFYKVLGLSSGATTQSIRKAYKSLVKEYHPDKNSNADAAQKFMEIQHAYEILSDPAKRQQYDQFRTVNGHEHSTEQQYKDGFRDFDRFFHQFAGAGRESFYFHMPNHQSFYTKHKITYR
uniref:DnaJ homolog subfamily B member 9 n=1 Tax=Romanomermis culicivorax TaxID=13658 RepID=A0A915KGB2_ROMCU